MHLVLCCLFWSLLFRHFNSALFVDITRSTNGDIFTNQLNDTWCVNDCGSHGGDCTTTIEDCCSQCRCRSNQTSFLRHKNQCISSKMLTSVLFRDTKQGCSYRLVANDYQDSRPRGRHPCDFRDLTLLALDQAVNGSQLIDVCGIFSWSISSCVVMSGAYYDRGLWKDLWNAGSNQTMFSIDKRLGVAIHLKWDDSLSSRYHGYILSLDVRCKRKFGRTDVDSCLVFKVRGTQSDERPSTAPAINYTAAPRTVIRYKNTSEPSDPSMKLIVVGVICGSFALLLLCLIIWCLWKGKGLHVMLWRKGQAKVTKQEPVTSSDHSADVAMTTSSPLYDVNIYQCVDNLEPPVYSTPDKAGYQDLLSIKPTYQQLIPKSFDSPDSPMYHTLEYPCNNNTQDDVTTQEYHVYQVLETP